MHDQEQLLNHVNRYGVLKITAGLWAVFLFESYPLWANFLLRLGSSEIPGLARFYFGYPWIGYAASLPATLMLLAALQREPEGGQWMRKLWSQGRLITTLSVLTHMTGLLFGLWMARQWEAWPEHGMVVMVLLQIAVLHFLWRTNYARQVFREFPKAAVT